METRKLSTDEIQYIALFESITRAHSMDCIVDLDEGKVTYVVKNGDMGLAIGKKGVNINRVKKTLGKNVVVIEYSDDPTEFVKNIFHPLRVKNVELQKQNDATIARVTVDDRDRASAIGRGGKNIQWAKMLAKRHHNIGDVIIT